MIDVYAIGTTLKLTDLITPQLLHLSREFAKVDALALQVNKRLKAMGSEVVGVRNLASAAKLLDGNLKSVTGEALNVERNLRSIRGAIPAGSLGIERELAEANRQVNILGRQLSALRSAGHNFPGGGGGGGGGRPPLPPLPPPPNPGGGRRRGHVHGGNMHVGPGGFGIGGVGMGIGTDLLIPLAAAGAATYVGHAFYDSAKEYQDSFMRFKALNLGQQVNDEANKFVRATHAFGVSQSELMKSMSESVGLFGSFEEASKFTPALVTLGKANSAIFGGKLGEMDDEGLKNLLKFIDRRGGFKDEKTFQSNLDLAERLVTGSGGFLKFQDLGHFSQMGGVAFRGLSDEGLMHMEGLMIEQGGSKAATALMSMYQNLVAGRTPKKTMGMLQDLGLAQLEMQTHGAVGGKPLKSLVMTGIKESSLLQSDPAKWMNDVLLPALAAKGITSQDQVLKAVNDVLSNRTASNQGSIMTTQQFQLLRDFKLAKGAMGASDVVNMYKDSASGAEKDFAAAWADFKKTFGETMLPAITSMLRAGTSILRTITNADANMKDEQSYVNEGHGVWDRMKRMWNWHPGMEDGNSHAASSLPPSKDGSTDGGAGDVYLDGNKVGKHVARTLSSQLGSGFYTGSIDNSVSLPMAGLKN